MLLYRANVLIMGKDNFGGVASLIFLPAFTRLLGFLLIRHWTIPALFAAAWFCVDLGLDPKSQFIVALSLAVGSPIAIGEVSRAIGLSPSLANLNGKKLLLLSAASALGSGAAYHIGLSVVGAETSVDGSFMATVVGDALGTWAIIYSLKAVLTLVGRQRRKA